MNTSWSSPRDDAALAVGLDFSFSLPAWYLREEGLTTADALWAAAATDGERWLRECARPFWGRRGTRRPDLPDHFRATEQAIASVGSIRPKSTFQVSGAGSVGAGSIRGFPMLARLRAAGFSVWPFHAGVPPVVVEVWPRALTGPVVKSRADARVAYLAERYPAIDAELATRAARQRGRVRRGGVGTGDGGARHRAGLVATGARPDDTARGCGVVAELPVDGPSAHAGGSGLRVRAHGFQGRRDRSLVVRCRRAALVDGRSTPPR